MSFSLPLGAETQLGRRIKNEPEDEGGYGRLQPFSTPDPNKRKRGVISAPAVADAPSKGHGKTASGSNRNQTFRGIKNEPSGDKYSDDDMKCGPRDGSSEDEPVKGRTTVGAEKKRISRQGCVPVPWAKKESDLARKLRNEGKSYEQISVELRGALGSIRTKSAVRQECHRQARRQMEWSSEDDEYLRQAVESFDRCKAITDTFNKLTGRSVGKGDIRAKLRSLKTDGEGIWK